MSFAPVLKQLIQDADISSCKATAFNEIHQDIFRGKIQASNFRFPFFQYEKFFFIIKNSK